MKSLTYILAIFALLGGEIASAKTLKCRETLSFTNRSFTMNRDGSIGFNGTFIVLHSPIAVWGDGRPGHDVATLTGRARDKALRLVGMQLAISPKEACTSPDAPLGTSFTCSVKGADVRLYGEGSNNNVEPPVRFERVKLELAIRADIQLSFTARKPGPYGDPDEGVSYSLAGTVTEAQTGRAVSFASPALKQVCEIVD
ncbi:MAG TPA: hypothetical protein VFV50_13565 [Bdellovibrionales bacterium]|nr:hypothetical protein [Bdellovibrionales bacterium]